MTARDGTLERRGDAQVLGHARLAQIEPVDELAHRPLALPEQLEDAPPRRLRQNLKGRAHERDILPQSYITSLPECAACAGSPPSPPSFWP